MKTRTTVILAFVIVLGMVAGPAGANPASAVLQRPEILAPIVITPVLIAHQSKGMGGLVRDLTKAGAQAAAKAIRKAVKPTNTRTIKKATPTGTRQVNQRLDPGKEMSRITAARTVKQIDALLKRYHQYSPPPMDLINIGLRRKAYLEAPLWRRLLGLY